VARRRTTLGMASLVASVGASSDVDELSTRVLDAGSELLFAFGLRRWSMDDVADRAGVGRTSLYRRFAGRDELIYAVLARELHVVIAQVNAAVHELDRLEDKVIEGALVALDAVDGSLVTRLIASDPSTFLPFLTTEAGPLVALARELLIAQAMALGAVVDREEAAQWAEIAARLGLSFILTRETVFPSDDREAARRTLQRVLGPLLAPLTAPEPSSP
jgi:AcrR family transcriptional regulator